MNKVLAVLLALVALNACGNPAIAPELRISSGGHESFTSPAIAYFRTNSLPFLNVEETTEVLDEIESEIAVAKEISTVHVDIILMQHNSQDELGAFDANSTASQTMVQTLLRANNYDLIGYEGSTLLEVSPSALVEEHVATGKIFGIPADAVERSVMGYVENDGVLLYQRGHPEVWVTGIEFTPLNTIQEFLILKDYRDGFTDTDSIVFDYIKDLRSEIALAKLLNLAHLNQKKKVALVIGANHGKHLVHLARAWNCGGTFYRALTEKEKLNPLHQLG